MPVTGAREKDPSIAGPLGGLLLGGVRAPSPMMVVRTLKWYRDLARLGIHLPLFMVHDIGLLYASPREQLQIGPRQGVDAAIAKTQRLPELVAAYRDIVAEIAQSEASA